MIISCENGSWKENNNMFQALMLQENKQEIISFTGGGGKTTLIRKLQRELKEKDIFHGVTTTTHMQYERNGQFLSEASIERFLEIYKKERTVWMGEPVSEIKMKGFLHDFYDKVIKFGAWLLVEADGAKRLPVKAPRENEPVILEQTTRVCNVYGLDGIGKRISDTCFCIEQVTQLLKKDKEAYLEEDDIVTLGLSILGGRKLVGERPYHIILNKADNDKMRDMAIRIGNKLAYKGIEHIHITAGL